MPPVVRAALFGWECSPHVSIYLFARLFSRHCLLSVFLVVPILSRSLSLTAHDCRQQCGLVGLLARLQGLLCLRLPGRRGAPVYVLPAPRPVLGRLSRPCQCQDPAGGRPSLHWQLWSALRVPAYLAELHACSTVDRFCLRCRSSNLISPSARLVRPDPPLVGPSGQSRSEKEKPHRPCYRCDGRSLDYRTGRRRRGGGRRWALVTMACLFCFPKSLTDLFRILRRISCRPVRAHVLYVCATPGRVRRRADFCVFPPSSLLLHGGPFEITSICAYGFSSFLVPVPPSATPSPH